MQIIFQAITTFYTGRPTRGTTLNRLIAVQWSGHHATHPWRLDAQGCPIYSTKFHLQDITRRVRKYVEDPDQPTEPNAQPEGR